MALGHQQEGGAVGSVGLQQGQGFGLDRVAEFAPVAVEGLAFTGQRQGAFGVLAGE